MLVQPTNKLSLGPGPPTGTLDPIQAGTDMLPRVLLAGGRRGDRASELLPDVPFELEPTHAAPIQEDLCDRCSGGPQSNGCDRRDHRPPGQLHHVVAVERERSSAQRADEAGNDPREGPAVRHDGILPDGNGERLSIASTTRDRSFRVICISRWACWPRRTGARSRIPRGSGQRLRPRSTGSSPGGGCSTTPELRSTAGSPAAG